MMKVEEDEVLHIGWYVFIVNVYLIVLFQTMYIWIRRIVIEESELSHGNETSFHLLKENVEEEVVLKVKWQFKLEFKILKDSREEDIFMS